jgi:hypothetical protein
MYSLYEQFVNYMSVQSLKAMGTVDATQADQLQTYLDNDRILSYGGTPIEVSQDAIAAVDKRIQGFKTAFKFLIYGAVAVGGVALYLKISSVVKNAKG